MNVLVTGANGFLGRYVVGELLRRGHTVRALVRPSAPCTSSSWDKAIDLFRADLRTGRELIDAFRGVDALVHLAAGVRGDDEFRFRSTVVGTEHLLDAMAQSTTKRLILISSFSVYDWNRVGRTLTEASPIEGTGVYDRDGYAIAKVWQERVVRERSRSHGWDLTVLRPAALWGTGNECPPTVGVSMGRVQVVVGAWSTLALSHVENCADAIVTASERREAIDETFNVVDRGVSPWKFMREYLRRSPQRSLRILLPYHLGLMVVTLTHRVARLVLGENCRVPSVFVPCRFKARFRPVRCNAGRLWKVLNWVPPYTFEECLDRTYGTHQEDKRLDANVEQGQQCLTQ